MNEQPVFTGGLCIMGVALLYLIITAIANWIDQ